MFQKSPYNLLECGILLFSFLAMKWNKLVKWSKIVPRTPLHFSPRSTICSFWVVFCPDLLFSVPLGNLGRESPPLQQHTHSFDLRSFPVPWTLTDCIYWFMIFGSSTALLPEVDLYDPMDLCMLSTPDTEQVTSHDIADHVGRSLYYYFR